MKIKDYVYTIKYQKTSKLHTGQNPEQTQDLPQGRHLSAGMGVLGGGVGGSCWGKGHLGYSTDCVATATLTPNKLLEDESMDGWMDRWTHG